MQTVIVRYEGALAQSVEREIPGATTVELFNEYGVVTIPDGQLETLRALPEVEYIELPKRLYLIWSRDGVFPVCHRRHYRIKMWRDCREKVC